MGAGGIGATIGARLHLAGYQVLLIARGDHGAEIRKRGLRFVAPNRDSRLPIDCVLHPADVQWQQSDVVIVAVKSQQTVAALQDLQDVHPNAVVVCAQNGVCNEREAQRLFANVIGMVVHLPAVYLEPGEVVTHAEGSGGVLDAGVIAGDCQEYGASLCSALVNSGFSSRVVEDVMRWKYAKLVVNLINAVQGTVGEKHSKRILSVLRAEALACFEAAQIDCATRDEVRHRHKDTYKMVDLPGHDRSGSSTWQSLLRGTGNVETEYLNGEISKIGASYAIPTPGNDAMVFMMQQVLDGVFQPGEVPIEEFERALDLSMRS